MTQIPSTPSPTEPNSKETNKDAKLMAMLAHLLGIFTGFLGALVIWLVKKDDSEFVADQAKEALNFQITVLIAWVACGVLSCLFIGIFLIPVVAIANLILCIMGAMKANDGVRYRYPFALRLIK